MERDSLPHTRPAAPARWPVPKRPSIWKRRPAADAGAAAETAADARSGNIAEDIIKLKKKFIIIAGKLWQRKDGNIPESGAGGGPEGKRTMLLDMDIVNPYFRSSKRRSWRPRVSGWLSPALPTRRWTCRLSRRRFILPLTCLWTGRFSMPEAIRWGRPPWGSFMKNLPLTQSETEFLYIINAMRPMQGKQRRNHRDAPGD